MVQILTKFIYALIAFAGKNNYALFDTHDSRIVGEIEFFYLFSGSFAQRYLMDADHECDIGF